MVVITAYRKFPWRFAVRSYTPSFLASFLRRLARWITFVAVGFVAFAWAPSASAQLLTFQCDTPNGVTINGDSVSGAVVLVQPEMESCRFLVAIKFRSDFIGTGVL